MTIKGGLLDCDGQAEIEENLNRIQERYGYKEVIGNVEKIHPINSEYLPAAESVANATGTAVTATEFNALLSSLRNAGYLKEEQNE